MQNSKHKIDGLFKEGFADFEVMPPPVVWDRISETMGHKKRKTRALWWWSMSGAASIIFAFIAGWYLSNRTNINDNVFVELELLKQNQIETSINETPTDNKIQIHFDKPQLKNASAALFNSSKTQLQSDIDKLNNKSGIHATDIEVNEPIELMYSIYTELKTSINNFALMKGEEGFNEFDKKIIEANLLAMNNENQSPLHEGNWLVGVQASPVYRFEQLAGDNKFYATGPDNMGNSVSTAYEPNLAGGLSLAYETGNKMAFITGVNYTEVSQNSGYVGISFSDLNWFNSNKDYLMSPVTDDIDLTESAQRVVVYTPDNVILNTNIGMANIVLPEGSQISYNSKLNNTITEKNPNYDFKQAAGYIEIPLLVKYMLVDKRFGVHLLGGINTNILVANNVNLLNNGNVVAKGNIENLSPVTYSSSLGMGMNYKVSEHFRINVDPTLKIQLNSLNVETSFNAKPYAFGIFSGITYQF